MAPKQPAAKTPRGGAYVELRGVFVYTITDVLPRICPTKQRFSDPAVIQRLILLILFCLSEV